MAQLEMYKGGYYLWKYVPSLAGAVIFILIYLYLTGLLFWKLFRTRAWFCTWFCIGSLMEFIGYAARAGAHNKTGRLMPYVIQGNYLLLAPTLYAATTYMILGRIIRSVRAEHLSIIRVNWLTRIFVLADVFSLCVQGAAVGMMVVSSMASIGKAVALVGLISQLVSLALFGITAILFDKRIRQNPTPASYTTDAPWRQTLWALYIITSLIFIRSIFRFIEYAVGTDGYVYSHEWTMYLFDSIPMAFVTVVFWKYFPSSLRPSAEIEEVNLTTK